MSWFKGFLIGVFLTFIIIIVLANVYPPPPPVCTAPAPQRP